jgi:predicted RNA-binding Zn-ribbon protein involved in translation (DUF1610 family)
MSEKENEMNNHLKTVSDLTAYGKWLRTADNGTHFHCPHCGKVIATYTHKKIYQRGSMMKCAAPTSTETK